ncbi:hypothetical protein GGR51DRAFT_526193 [Nemania sp. FL0031]|nr:hypothetical protein GGR51DRAFT_526193 [Nemania sp. FL0031]
MDDNGNTNLFSPSPEPSGVDSLTYAADGSPYPDYYFLPDDNSPPLSLPDTPDQEPTEEIQETPSFEPPAKPKRKRENRYKNAPPSVISRRRAQNRASQRAYRERKDKRIKDLEVIIDDMKRNNDALKAENAMLRQRQNQQEVRSPQLFPSWNTSMPFTMPSSTPCAVSSGTLAELSHSPGLIGHMMNGGYQPNNSIFYTQFINGDGGTPDNAASYNPARLLSRRREGQLANSIPHNGTQFLNAHEEVQPNNTIPFDGAHFSNGQ